MRLAFVCSGRLDNLKYLTNNRSMVDELLTKHGWKVIQTPLFNISDLNKRLQEYQGSNIDEFLFFYTGHGDVSNRQQILKLQLENTEISMNDVLDSIFKYINPKKQAIVLDACYSGTLKDLVLEKNTEFLFSSQAREQSYEDNKLKASVFSFYFCEAVTNGYVKLEEISKYIDSSDDRQKPLPLSVGSECISIVNANMKVEKKVILETLTNTSTNMNEKLEEIENLIISNDLIIATTMIVQLIDEFSKNKNLKIEALLHKSSVKALNDDIRKFGKSSEIDREIKLLKNSLFEFLEILKEK